METELRFALSPKARRQIEDKAMPSATTRQGVEIDHATYFDTAERDLKRAGFSLRIRHNEGNRRFTQAVKSSSNGTDKPGGTAARVCLESKR